jgi:cell division transport system permease protein
MKLRSVGVNIRQGLVGLWRNRTMSLASITSLSATLIILGIVLLLIINTNYIASHIQDEFDDVKIFLKDGLSIVQVEAIGEEILGYDEVVDLTYISKTQALENFKEDWGDEASLLEGLESDNPLPDSFILHLKTLRNVEPTVAKIEQIDGIEEVNFFSDVIEKVLNVTDFIRSAGLVLIGVLVFIAVFIINNTIKITITARKKEIAIMKHVGATNGFIRGPFIVEGVCLGLVGSALAYIIIDRGYSYLIKAARDKYLMVNAYVMPHNMIIMDILIVFFAIGVGIGIVGSVISLKKYLKV